MRKKERFGREISLPKVALSSLKMQRKCRKEKDKKFCTDETKRKMARDTNNPLFDQHCAFTGRLQKYTRKEAMQIVAAIGGFSEKAVTKKT